MRRPGFRSCSVTINTSIGTVAAAPGKRRIQGTPSERRPIGENGFPLRRQLSEAQRYTLHATTTPSLPASRRTTSARRCDAADEPTAGLQGTPESLPDPRPSCPAIPKGLAPTITPLSFQSGQRKLRSAVENGVASRRLSFCPCDYTGVIGWKMPK